MDELRAFEVGVIGRAAQRKHQRDAQDSEQNGVHERMAAAALGDLVRCEPSPDGHREPKQWRRRQIDPKRERLIHRLASESVAVTRR
jgi:hypothetical protein